ncbi:tyrosine-protein phosphatase non-receptor type substrate 1-like isoform X2 [Polypterus senegalus]|uniref:tyrosine-protein phosphatase non-receptor type substrate 1-like isoform X2 n=1 Tax=Polypterus senegalus TaxID=55291 RepID=UPI001965D933|nr:tyrosine-protein phosphatase non-receptor type substrate 1-like isoform X2 [Polypterus senegalus]
MLIRSAASICLIFLLVRGLNISQPQGQVEAKEGSNITLVCTMTSETPVGPVRWYKGADSKHIHFYSEVPKGGDHNDPRVTWTMENPTVNYSITVRDVRVNDTGEYYCVKYTKADEEKPYTSGPGINMTVKVTDEEGTEMTTQVNLPTSTKFTCMITQLHSDIIKTEQPLVGQTLSFTLHEKMTNTNRMFTTNSSIDFTTADQRKRFTCVVTHMENMTAADSIPLSSGPGAPLWVIFILVKLGLFVMINAFLFCAVNKENWRGNGQGEGKNQDW